MTTMHIRRATIDDYPELMRLIDNVFFPQKPQGFRDLLPNLYSDPAVATREAYLAIDGARIVGHLGVYPIRLRVGKGIELSAGGIGAVATDPEYRGKGVMASTLKAAIEGMSASSYDLSVLWGDRLRYLHYGWETVGQIIEWRFDDRIARNIGVDLVELSPFEMERHLEPLVTAWNLDDAGTVHDLNSMRGLLARKQWQTAIHAENKSDYPCAFVTYQISGNDIIVDKLVGAIEKFSGMLLSLRQQIGGKSSKLMVRCPPMPHPVARLGVQMNSQLSLRAVCQARLINIPSLRAKLQIKSQLSSEGCEAVRELFGTPADVGTRHFPLWIEGPAIV